MADASVANPSLSLIGMDIGSSQIKLVTPQTKLSLVSQVARDAGHVSRADGAQVKAAHRPTLIKSKDGASYVGPNAHTWGDRTEHHDILSTQRLLGGPKVRDLFRGALTELIHQCGPLTAPLAICVGTPIDIDRAGRAQVESWIAGTHEWDADGQPMCVHVQHAHTVPQTSAAIFEYVLQANGAKDKSREPRAGQTWLMVSGGLWDLQIEGRMWDGKAWVELPNATHNWAYGTAQMYAKFPRAETRTIGALDRMHFAGGLEDPEIQIAWADEAFEKLDRAVGAWGDFDVVIPYGGILKLPAVAERFEARLGDNYVRLPDPVFTQASGMCKWLRAKYRQ